MPVEHLHGHAARDPGRRRAPGVRGLQPRRPVRVVRATSRPSCAGTGRKAAFLVHIGGHVAFEVQQIADLCAAEGVFLIEDCAHAHGAAVGRPPAGHVGRRGRLLLLRDQDGLDRARAACWCRAATTCSSSRAPTATTASPTTGRGPELPDERVHRRARRSCRPSAWRRSSLARTPSAREQLDPVHPGRLAAAGRDGLRPLQVHRLRPHRALDGQGLRPSRATGIMGTGDDLPNSDWVGEHHWCVPLYYRQAMNGAHACMRVLVTGGAGLHRLARRRSPAARRGIDAAHLRRAPVRRTTAPARSTPCAATCSTATRCSAAMRGCDAVVHLAAAADVDDVAQRPAEAEAVNARGTLNVLEAARGAGVARVVYASTIWVYGSADRRGRRGPRRSSCPTTSTRRPSSPARCTAAPTRSCTACSARSCASASPTARARGRRR